MQYHSEKFLIIKNIKKFILDIEKILVNFPNKDYFNKDMFYKEALSVFLKSVKQFSGKVLSKMLEKC